MRRIGRWMLNALTALSLLLCVGTCVLWVRSYWLSGSLNARAISDNISAGPGTIVSRARSQDAIWLFVREIGVARGKIWAWSHYTQWVGTPHWSEFEAPPHPWQFRDEPAVASAGLAIPTNSRDPFARSWTFGSFGVTVPRKPAGDPERYIGYVRRYYALTIPLWAFVALFSVLPLRWGVRAWRRTRAGRCKSCNYDLTGNVSGICPECGMEIIDRKLQI